MRALLSVSDKTGLIDFARGLASAGFELVASGGTAQALREAGLEAASVEDLTGLPGLLGGRVKTLHPAIHAGILARDTEEDRATLQTHGWGLIDLVAVNLYPFAEAAAREGAAAAEIIEQIDIGGVALLRAAAKNHERVTVVTSPADYGPVLEEVRARGNTALETRRALAARAFAVTASYDQAITAAFAGRWGSAEPLPATLSLALPRSEELRYGENPHQRAALYAPPDVGPLGGKLLQGKQLSYNNLLDLDAAWTAATDFVEPTVVVVKHLSPTGIASGPLLPETLRAALASDPLSAFGSVIAANRPFDRPTAEALGDLFVEAIAAPEFSAGAREALAARPGCRLLRMQGTPGPDLLLRSVRGGLLAQTPDAGDSAEWVVVTERKPSAEEYAALRFAWQAVKHVKSNGVVLATERATVGIGGGLPSRVDAVTLAVRKAGMRARGAALASDAFFPFPDGLEVAAAAGVTAIVQPGGSVRDDEVIDAANRLGLAMCFTGVRHFRH